MNAFERHREEIASILDERFYPLSYIADRVADGSIALMSNDSAVIGVERRHYPGGAVELHGLFAAGDMAGILELIDLAVSGARDAGCSVATIASKPGWARVLKSRGFEPKQLTIMKDLRDGV